MAKHIPYNGKKIAYVELTKHQYAHVDVVDGEKVEITREGQLIVTTGPRRSDRLTPALWNFVDDKSEVAVGVHNIVDGLLPELHPNIIGECA